MKYRGPKPYQKTSKALPATSPLLVALSFLGGIILLGVVLLIWQYCRTRHLRQKRKVGVNKNRQSEGRLGGGEDSRLPTKVDESSQRCLSGREREGKAQKKGGTNGMTGTTVQADDSALGRINQEEDGQGTFEPSQ